MSFSSNIKEEISRLNTFKDKNAIKYELIGYLITNNTNIIKNKIKYSTENEYNINRLNKLLKTLFIEYDIKMQGNLYVISFKKDYLDEFTNIIEIYNNFLLKDTSEMIKEQNIKALVRGSFLGSGFVNNPNGKYHLEIIFNNKENATIIKNILEMFDIYFKELNRRSGYSLYMKEGEEISKILAFIGASSSVLKFEEIRVMKETRNNINRMVNCETANLNKTVSAAVRQIEAIKLLKKENKFKELNDSLKEIAELRLENPDSSLIELGKKLKQPVGKSGVNYRLNKIMEIADELKKK